MALLLLLPRSIESSVQYIKPSTSAVRPALSRRRLPTAVYFDCHTVSSAFSTCLRRSRSTDQPPRRPCTNIARRPHRYGAPLLRALLARKRVRLACARVLEGGQRSASVARTCLLNLLN